jgi:phosphohistidine phosphatase SixA
MTIGNGTSSFSKEMTVPARVAAAMARGYSSSGRRRTAALRVCRLAIAACAISLIAAVATADDSRDAWAALVNGGHVALIRHGSAPPGYGDPPGFKIDDCATQRNMDEKGRAQARALGETFRQHGVHIDKILSSPWCRCLETARLMALGQVENTWAVAASEKSPERLAALKQMVSSWRGPGTLVVVTHALTVQALVGILPGQAETVVLRPKLGDKSGVDVVGRIPVPE